MAADSPEGQGRGALALSATVVGIGVHKWIWSGDINPEVDNCTSPTQQQVVVDRPEGSRYYLRRAYDFLPGWQAPSKEGGLYPTTVGGLVETMQTQRSYVMSEQQFVAQNQAAKGSEGTPLFTYDTEGKLVQGFENNGIYCVNVPAPIRAGTHLVTENDTTLGEVSEGYRVPMEQMMQMNPDLRELERDDKLPRGTVVAVSEQQSDLVLQQADTEAMRDYLTLPHGRFDKRQWQYISWENRAYDGITAIEPNDELMFMPYDPTASRRLDGDSLPAASSSLFEQHEDITPESILAANPRTVIGVPSIDRPSRSGDRPDARPQAEGQSKEGRPAGGEKQASPEHTKGMEADLAKFGVPERFIGLYMEKSAKYGLSPFLLAAKDWQESRWDPEAESHVGALGLGQAMPDTWKWYQEMGVVPSHARATDPAWNIEGNAWYLRYLLDKAAASNISGSELNLALAAYNAGPGTVFNKVRGIPDYPETRHYVAAITGKMEEWGRTEVYYNDALDTYVSPADYKEVATPPDNPIERRAYYAQKLGLKKGDIRFTMPNGIYQFDIDPRVAESQLGIDLYGNYPAKWRKLPLDGAVDDWKMFTKECVSYAAWRVENDDRPGGVPAWGGRDNQPDTPGHQGGDAHFWDGNAREAGVPVDKTPAVGSVAVWNRNGTEHAWKGHVAYVERIMPDGSLIVSQYNNGGDGEYSVEILSPQYRQLVSDQLKFIHFERGE